MPVPTVPDWLGILLFGIRYVQNNGAAVDDTRTLNFTTGLTAAYNSGTGCIDVAAGAGAITSVTGTNHVSCSTTAGVVTVTCDATANPTSSTICLRDGGGGISGLYFQTASSVNSATSGVLRLPTGDGTVIAIKPSGAGAIPILSTASSGAQIVLGDGTQFVSVSFNAALLSNCGSLTFSNATTQTITQTIAASTGAAAGLTLTLKAQAGQAQSGANANNNGGTATISGGDAGTGGSGAAGARGFVSLVGPVTATLGANGFTAPTFGAGGTTAQSASQIALNLSGPGALITLYTGNTGTGSFLSWGSNLSINSGNSFAIQINGGHAGSFIAMDTNSISGIQLNGNTGFFGANPIARPTVTGSKASGAALVSLLAALVSLGLISDTTTA